MLVLYDCFVDTFGVWQRCETASAWVGTFILFLPLSRLQGAHFREHPLESPPQDRVQGYHCSFISEACWRGLTFLLKEMQSQSISKSGNTALWSLLKTLVRMMSARMRVCFCQGWEWGLKFISVCFYLLLACILLWNTGCNISLQKSTNDVLEIGFSHVLFKGIYCANTCMSAGSV